MRWRDKVYYSDDFEGAYPVPVAAVVIARSKQEAVVKFSELLKRHSLPSHPDTFTVREMTTNTLMISTGEY